MRISREDLAKHQRAVPPAPAPIEPELDAHSEAEAIAKSARGDADAQERRRRLVTVLRRHAPPEGRDVIVIALLAERKALPLDHGDDRLRARQRLVEIGRLKEPPPEVVALQQRLGVAPGDGAAFADALLGSRPPTTYEFSENFPVGGGG